MSRASGSRPGFVPSITGGIASTAARLAAALLAAGAALSGAGPLEAQQPSLSGPPSGLPMPEGTPSIVAPEGQGPATGVAGDHLMYVGTYQEAIYVIDEAREAVVDRIPLETGIPRSLFLSPDRSRFYVIDVSYENVEVVDIASRRTVNVFSLNEEDETVRIWNMAVAPGEQYAILLARSYRALPDRFEIGPMRLLRYDLERHEVMGDVPWPDGRERQNVNLRFSQDGRWLYFLMDDIRVYDTTDFTEVDRWAYTDALGEGMRDFSFGFPESVYDEPGFYTGLFRITDPVQDREIMGVARVSLDERRIDFTPMGPSESRLRFALAPGREKAFGLKDEVANYEFWTFDLGEGRVESRARFRGRSRMALEVSSSGDVLYVYNAGNTIDLYEADGYRYIRTIVLDADTTSGLIILPRPEPTADGP